MIQNLCSSRRTVKDLPSVERGVIVFIIESLGRVCSRSCHVCLCWRKLATVKFPCVPGAAQDSRFLAQNELGARSSQSVHQLLTNDSFDLFIENTESRVKSRTKLRALP
jgi:hypothetical protein